jgi:H+-translocating NAD(P) transhydrogenase subunit alpha
VQIAVLKETRPRERRVALNPDSVSALVKSGAKVSVEKGAGTASHFSDESYATAGASICASGADAASQSDLVTKVAPPLPEEVAIDARLHDAAGRP